MAKTKNKRNIQAKNNNKLKTLKDLRMCKVVLHNIALDKDLVQLYQLHFSEKKKKELEHSSPYINTSKNSNNVWMLMENIWEDNIEDETSRLTRSRSKKLIKKKNEEYKNVEFLDDILHNQYHKIIQPGFIAQKQQLKYDTDIELISSKNNDETSSTSSHTYCSHLQKKIISINNKKHCNDKSVQKKNKLGYKRIQFNKSDSVESMKISSDSENYLEKNLTITDCNNKMQEISSESIKNDVTICNVPLVRLEQYKKNQNSKAVFSNIINTDAKNTISGTSEDIKIDFKSKNINFSDNFCTIYNKINRTHDQKDARIRSNNKITSLTIDNTIQTNVSDVSLKSIYSMMSKTNVTKIPSDFLTTHANKTNNERITEKNLPKITGDHILPKGTIKIMKVNTSDESLQSNVSEQVFLKQSDINSSTKQVFHIDDTFESSSKNILREKEYHTLETDKSINILKLSESTVFNNNINLKNKNVGNELNSKTINYKNINSLMEIRNNVYNDINDIDSIATKTENCTWNHQEQSNRLDDGEEHENNILQDNKKCNKINSDENILNKNISNFININEGYNSNRSLIFDSEEKAIKQNRKRIVTEDTIKLDNKKRKLNRTIWSQNNITCAKSLNPKEFNDFPNIDAMITVESNISEENIPEQKIDLREHLNKKRSKSPKLLMFENKFNKNNVEFEQIDLNNKNEIKIITPSNTMQNEKFRKKLFFEKEPTFNKTLYKEKDVQTDPICNRMYYHSTLQTTSEEIQHLSQINKIHENINIQEKHTNSRNEDEDDDDCISLFAESFDTNLCENTFLNKQDKPSKSLHSDVPYIMTASSFNKYIKQNATEFNKEYAKYVEDSTEPSNKTDEIKKEFNNQSGQTIQIDHTDCVPETRTTSKVIELETKNIEISKCQLKTINFKNFINGYCFSVLRKGICYKQQLCRYKHELQNLIDAVCSEDSRVILDIMQDALYLGYNFFCKTIHVTSLQKLTVEQILIMYQMFHDIRIKEEITLLSKRHIIHNIIKELLNRQLSLKTIVNYLVEYITPSKDSNNLMNILVCIEKYIKRGEYWNTVKTLVLRLPPDKHIIQKILLDCIDNEKLIDIQDINNNLMSKIPPILISILDKDVLERFKSLLVEKTENNSPMVLVQNFGESLVETIASPDGNTNLSQTESPRHDNIFINKSANKINDHVMEMNGEIYTMRLIDDLPDARSVYRDHEHLWKFYVDLDRFKKGLLHHDYDYVINILKNYAEKQDENPLFVRSCCNILRTEVKHSEYHLKNIIRRTVQMGTFDILGKILFDIGLDILTNLVDNEAWGLALYLIQSLNIHDLSCNAEYFLLSAEIYLANKKAVKACDLLKYKNIICTSRDKWYVKSTINDEHVRSKIMYILLDLFCNEFIEYAFFLFQFLLKDQCSQYYPIDLSRYVDKLIILSLSKKDRNLITEMANLVLKYTFALSTITCRALISTLVHIDKNLAKQIYNYAEGIGIYPAMKLWPVIHISINTDVTEEEIYLTFLQLLKNLIINFGHAIEFAKPHQIKVYLILEIKSINEQFYCAKLQNHYNNKAITNIKALIRNVLKKHFDPPILLMPGSKGRIYKLQSKSVINYLKTEHCN